MGLAVFLPHDLLEVYTSRSLRKEVIPVDGGGANPTLRLRIEGDDLQSVIGEISTVAQKHGELSRLHFDGSTVFVNILPTKEDAFNEILSTIIAVKGVRHVGT